MNIRTASFRDLARIEELYQESVRREGDSAPLAGDSPVPEAVLVRLWHAVGKTLASLVPMADSGDVLYVAEDRGVVVGFIQAQPAAGKAKSWQILNLCVATSPGAGHFAAERLLTHLCNNGLEHGIHRFHVRLPVDHALIPLFLGQGFTQFATEQIVYHDDPAASRRLGQDDMAEGGSALHPARRDDLGAIYLLYLRTTPSHVAGLEGPSLKAWQAAFAQGMLARMGRDDVRHLVGENPGVSAWVGIRPPSGVRPTVLALMCESHDERYRESVIDAMLSELPPGPASCVLRHYDSELIRSLQKRGFAIYGSQVLLVRDLASKLRIKQVAARKKPVLVHAGVAQSVGQPSSKVSLQVLRSTRTGGRRET
ncbi:MAG TPA: GNAT family N-acetyltransferase [Candidatus Sulfotelmatobacter sp.]|nr:GNAT family N-acetyltransferase [Candidatus Sulfotelmatobacter sp.]